MTKTKRDILKRKVAQIYNHLDAAMIGLLELRAVFAPHHEDLGAMLEQMAQLLLGVQELVLKFWERAWGNRPSNISSWF